MLFALLLACRSSSPEPTDPAAVSCSDASAFAEEGTSRWSASFDWAWDDALGASAGPVFSLALPEQLASFAVSVDDPGASTGIAWLDLDEEVWIDGTLYEGAGAWDSAPYFHWATSGGTLTAPITPDTDPSGAGCMRVQPAAIGDLTGEQGTLWVVARAGVPDLPVLDLNVVLVGSASLTQAELDATLVTMDRIWASGDGPAVGTATTWTVPGDTYLRYADSTELRRTVVDSEPNAITLFLIEDYLDESGTLGEAGGIPGPIVPGMDEAGVIVALDGHRWGDGSLDTTLMGSTIAHEVGHQLGLYHSTEADGSRLEGLDDTPACPRSADTDGDGSWSAEECEAWDGANFMFWTAGSFVQETVSEQQGFVLARSPLVH